jgi:hypothetical protein
MLWQTYIIITIFLITLSSCNNKDSSVFTNSKLIAYNKNTSIYLEFKDKKIIFNHPSFLPPQMIESYYQVDSNEILMENKESLKFNSSEIKKIEFAKLGKKLKKIIFHIHNYGIGSMNSIDTFNVKELIKKENIFLKKIQFSKINFRRIESYEIFNNGKINFSIREQDSVAKYFKTQIRQEKVRKVFDTFKWYDFESDFEYNNQRHEDYHSAKTGLTFFYNNSSRSFFWEGSNGSPDLLEFYNFIRNIREIDQFESNIIEVDTMIIFDSYLATRNDLHDSIRYLSEFDSTNYKIAQFNNDFNKFFSQNFNEKFKKNGLLNSSNQVSEIKKLFVKLDIDSVGRISSYDIFENNYIRYSSNFKKELDRVFKKSPFWTPAVYNGKRVKSSILLHLF